MSSRREKEAVNLQAFVPLVTYPEPSGEAVAGHAALLAADIGPEIHALAINADDRPIVQTLQQTAITGGCQLLVMGGYGHSRVRDCVLEAPRVA